jgi:uncharacterized membrane protein
MPDVFSNATKPNPAWAHYIYLPFQIVIGIPVAMIGELLFGWYDIRFLYLLSFLLLAVCGMKLASDPQRRSIVLMLLLFNPLFVQFFVAGFNDVFFLGWIALGSLLLTRRRLLWASLAFGLAFASKQSAWFLIPFFLNHLFASTGGKISWRAIARSLAPACAVFMIVVVPFFLWSPKSFLDDTVQYASGSAAYSYPISGFGLGQLLLSSGVIKSMWDKYPFWIFELIVGIPLLIVLLRWQRHRPTVSRMLIAYGAFAAALWFVSRFFNDSYIGALSILFILAYAANDHERQTEA